MTEFEKLLADIATGKGPQTKSSRLSDQELEAGARAFVSAIGSLVGGLINNGQPSNDNEPVAEKKQFANNLENRKEETKNPFNKKVLDFAGTGDDQAAIDLANDFKNCVYTFNGEVEETVLLNLLKKMDLPVKCDPSMKHFIGVTEHGAAHLPKDGVTSCVYYDTYLGFYVAVLSTELNDMVAACRTAFTSTTKDDIVTVTTATNVRSVLFSTMDANENEDNYPVGLHRLVTALTPDKDIVDMAYDVIKNEGSLLRSDDIYYAPGTQGTCGGIMPINAKKTTKNATRITSALARVLKTVNSRSEGISIEDALDAVPAIGLSLADAAAVYNEARDYYCLN